MHIIQSDPRSWKIYFRDLYNYAIKYYSNNSILLISILP